MTDEQGYNGWTNYETWSVALIINNDQGTQEEMEELVRGTVEMADAQEMTVLTREENRRFEVADALKGWIEEWQPNSDDLHKAHEEGYNPFGYLWSQLIGAALSDVDWDDLAESFMQDVAEVSQDA